MIGIIGGTGFSGLNLSWHLQKEAVPRRTFSRNGLLLSPKSIFYPVLCTIGHVKGDFQIILFLGSMQLFVLEIIGEYLGRLFIESKRRPLYVIAEVVGRKSDVS